MFPLDHKVTHGMLPLLLPLPVLLVAHRQSFYANHSRDTHRTIRGRRLLFLFQRRRTPKASVHTRARRNKTAGPVQKLVQPLKVENKNTPGSVPPTFHPPTLCHLLALTDSSLAIYVLSRLRCSYRRRTASWICLAAFSFSRSRFLSHERVCFCGNDSNNSQQNNDVKKNSSRGRWYMSVKCDLRPAGRRRFECVSV